MSAPVPAPIDPALRDSVDLQIECADIVAKSFAEYLDGGPPTAEDCDVADIAIKRVFGALRAAGWGPRDETIRATMAQDEATATHGREP